MEAAKARAPTSWDDSSTSRSELRRSNNNNDT